MLGHVEKSMMASWVERAWSPSWSWRWKSVVRNSSPAWLSSTLEPGLGVTGLTSCSHARLRSSQ